MSNDNDKQTYFEQYKMLVESAEKVSDKRMTANNYFLTINTALISITGLFISSNFLSVKPWFACVVGGMGLIICIIWFLIVLSYKQLNSGKFQMIHKLEEKLPVKVFSNEWKILGEGKDIKKYFPLSHIEMGVPFVFGLLYLVLLFIKI